MEAMTALMAACWGILVCRTGQLGMLGCKRTAAVTTKNNFLAVIKHLAKQLEEVRAHCGLELSIDEIPGPEESEVAATSQPLSETATQLPFSSSFSLRLQSKGWDHSYLEWLFPPHSKESLTDTQRAVSHVILVPIMLIVVMNHKTHVTPKGLTSAMKSKHGSGSSLSSPTPKMCLER